MIYRMWNTILGAVLALAGGVIATRYQYRRDVRGLRFALAAELSSVTNLIWHRKYLENLREHIAAVELTRVPSFFQVRISKNYDVIFLGNAGRIGILHPRLTSRITIVYYRMAAIREDLETLADAARKAPGTEWLWELKNCINFHKQLLELSESTIPLMVEAARRLEKRDHRGWPVKTRTEELIDDVKWRLFGFRYNPKDDIV